MSKKEITPETPAPAPATPPAPEIKPENIMNQSISIDIKNAEKSIKDAAQVFSRALNEFTSQIKSLIKPEAPTPPTPPAPQDPPPPKKSAFKSIEEEIDKIWGF